MKEKTISPTLTLLALAISAFGIGSAEFISVGLMPMLVTHFDISLRSAGLTVSMYALGIMIGAPILTLLTGRIQRKPLLLLTMATFIIGAFVSGLAISFPMLLVGRVITALTHGVFMSTSTVIAADVVAPSKRASAIAMLFTGLTVATITGVPLGTFIGQTWGWEWAFFFITLIGIIALIADQLLTPSNLAQPGISSIKGFVRIFKNRQLVLALVITALGYGGPFVAYTYLSPLLNESMGWSEGAVVLILIGYGLMVAIGNTIGGRLANIRPLRAVMIMFLNLIASLVLLQLGATSHWLGLFAVLLMGLFAFMNVPGLQLIIVQFAEKYTPNDINLASSLNISGFNLGIYMGSTIGGLIVSGIGITATPIFGALMVFLGVIFTFILMRVPETETTNSEA